MSDSYVTGNPGVGGARFDAEEVIDGGGNRLVRERVQITGKNFNEKAEVTNAEPLPTLYGVVVRTVPNAAVVVSTANSTTTPLGANVSFSGGGGQGESVNGYSGIIVNLAGSPDGALGTLFMEFSNDQATWDISIPISINNLLGAAPFPYPVVLPFFRVRYVNGATPQGAFRLTTVLTRGDIPLLRRTLATVLDGSDTIPTVRAVCEPNLFGPNGTLSAMNADVSIGGELVTAPFIVQYRARFDLPIANSDVTPTSTGGAPVPSTAAGILTMQSAAGAGASSAVVVTNRHITYGPGREFRAEFSALFASAGIANSTILVGLSDQAGQPNRLAVGYQGVDFGFTIESAGSITLRKRSTDWNGDKCDGKRGSLFTSGGKPVVADFTKGNAWRIRGVWFGVGPIFLQVRAPDGHFVTVHVERYPNTATVPYIQNPDLFGFAEVTKTGGAGAGQLTFNSFCWVGGSVQENLDIPVEGSSFGHVHNPTVLTVVPVRSTTYTEQTTNAIRSVSSNNANDAAAGTGARTLKITYYDAACSGPFTETITLNGVNPVDTVNSNICFIEKIEVLTVGSTGASVGTITLFKAAAGGGGVLWTIVATENQTFSAHHYVGAGRTTQIEALRVGSGSAFAGLFQVTTRDPTNINAAALRRDEMRIGNTNVSFDRVYINPPVVTGPAIITINIVADANTGDMYASLDWSDRY